jgi:hypothetical protein
MTVVMTELPVVGVQAVVQLYAASVTVTPGTGLLVPSNSVTVIVEVDTPSSGTEVGAAVTVDLLVLTAPSVNCTSAFALGVTPSVVSVAVYSTVSA